MLERFMGQIAQELELPQLAKAQAPGAYVIPVDEQLAMEVSELDSGFYFRARLAPIPLEQQAQFYETLLLANLLGQGTEGAILAIDPDSREVILCQLTAKEVDYRSFRDTFEDFMNTADIWRAETLQPHLFAAE